MSEKTKTGRPWATLKSFDEFVKADAARNSIKEHNPTWEVKVNLMADGHFNVKVRKPPTNPKMARKGNKKKAKKIK